MTLTLFAQISVAVSKRKIFAQISVAFPLSVCAVQDLTLDVLRGSIIRSKRDKFLFFARVSKQPPKMCKLIIDSVRFNVGPIRLNKHAVTWSRVCQKPAERYSAFQCWTEPFKQACSNMESCVSKIGPKDINLNLTPAGVTPLQARKCMNGPVHTFTGKFILLYCVCVSPKMAHVLVSHRKWLKSAPLHLN